MPGTSFQITFIFRIFSKKFFLWNLKLANFYYQTEFKTFFLFLAEASDEIQGSKILKSEYLKSEKSFSNQIKKTFFQTSKWLLFRISKNVLDIIFKESHQLTIVFSGSKILKSDYLKSEKSFSNQVKKTFFQTSKWLLFRISKNVSDIIFKESHQLAILFSGNITDGKNTLVYL